MNIDPLTTNTLPGRKVHQHRGMIEMPPRSELYCLAPLGVGTVEVESLTSYIQRLAWAYRVNPRVLVAEVILPRLGQSYYSDLAHLGRFRRKSSMSINGDGEVARDWARKLE